MSKREKESTLYAEKQKTFLKNKVETPWGLPYENFDPKSYHQ